MHNWLFSLFLLVLSISLPAQSVSSLEKKLKSTKDDKLRMELFYQLGNAYLGKDNKKASENAGKAQSLAATYKNPSLGARAAYVGGSAHYHRKAYGAATSRYKQCITFAKSAKDVEYGLKCYAKLETIEKDKKKNYRAAYNYAAEAKKFLQSMLGSSSGGSTSTTRPSSGVSSQEVKELNRKIDALEQEKVSLLRDIRELEAGRDQWMSDQDKLTEKQRKLLREERAQAEKTISEKELELASVEERREAAEARVKRKEKQLSKLSDEDKVKTMMLQEAELEIQAAELKATQEANKNNIYKLLSAFGLAIGILFYLRFRANRKAKRALEEKNKEVEAERQRSDELLLNILPANIAQELKNKGKAEAQKYFNSTVLFSDFKNFTRLSEKLTPEQLVEELDYCFKGFDFIISQYETIEKIKTIGDAYMCAAGLTAREIVPNDIVKAALEMQEFLEDYKKEKMAKGEPYFEARIGIHTGPVVAGVVGVNKFAYDIWGDTVNIASRMEQNCEVGMVNISESTYRQVKYNFNCIPRGRIAAKNKGEIEMYYVRSAN